MFNLPGLRPVLQRSATPATTLLRSFSASARRDYASLTVVGRLGAKPEMAVTNGGTEFVKYNVASTTGSGDNQRTSWFKVSSFRANNKDYLLGLEKGSLVLVECHAQLSSYDNPEGKRVTALVSREKTFRLLERRRAAEEATEES